MCENQTLVQSSTAPRLQSAQLPVFLELVLTLVEVLSSVALVPVVAVFALVVLALVELSLSVVAIQFG
jgi:hypothetical protein